MNPFLFGSSERPLLGVYTPAAGERRRRGVVICPPLGQEYLTSHRTCRILASRMAEAGLDVLRFDYFGTGNSGGDSEDVSIEGAVEDTLGAIEEIKDLASLRSVTLVGLRAGALVASLASERSPKIDQLVLWDPVSDVRDYVEREILTGEPLGSDGTREVLGFVFPQALQEGLLGAGLMSKNNFPEDILLVVCQDLPSHRRLEAHLRGAGSVVDFSCFEGPPPWAEEADLGMGAVPAEALKRMVML